MANPAVPAAAYSGIDHLDVMQAAENYNRHLLGMIRKHARSGSRLLDFGAGAGQFALPLTKLGFDVTAVELDASLRERMSAAGLNTTDTANSLPSDQFDLIYTLNVLEHIQDDVGALRQLRDKLKPGGQLLIYVPAFQCLYTSMDAKVGHLRRYSRSTLGAAVTTAGYIIDRVAYVDSLGFLATLLFKWLGNRDGELNRNAVRLYDRWIFPSSRTLDWLTNRCFGKNLLLVAHR